MPRISKDITRLYVNASSACVRIWWRCRDLNPVARQLTALLKLLDIFSLTGIECITLMVFFVPVYAVLTYSYSVSHFQDVLIFSVAYPPADTHRSSPTPHGSTSVSIPPLAYPCWLLAAIAIISTLYVSWQANNHNNHDTLQHC